MLAPFAGRPKTAKETATAIRTVFRIFHASPYHAAEAVSFSSLWVDRAAPRRRTCGTPYPRYSCYELYREPPGASIALFVPPPPPLFSQSGHPAIVRRSVCNQHLQRLYRAFVRKQHDIAIPVTSGAAGAPTPSERGPPCPVADGARYRGTGPHPIDVHVGRKVRIRRGLPGVSQEPLGRRPGLTF